MSVYKSKREQLLLDGFTPLFGDELKDNVFMNGGKTCYKCSACGVWNDELIGDLGGGDIVSCTCKACNTKTGWSKPKKQIVFNLEKGSDKKGILKQVEALLKESVGYN